MSDKVVQEKPPEKAEKRSYHTPKLEELGKVAVLTLGGSLGIPENGSMDENETRP